MNMSLKKSAVFILKKLKSLIYWIIIFYEIFKNRQNWLVKFGEKFLNFSYLVISRS